MFFGAIFALVLLSSLTCNAETLGSGAGHNSPAAGILVYIIMPIVVGIAAVLVSLGSLAQFVLRKRPLHLTVFTDIGLFVLFGSIIVYAQEAYKCSN